MAKYIVEDTSLIAVADAIRAKTGKGDPLTLADMPTEVESIEVGGGGSDAELNQFDALLSGTITEIDSQVTVVNDYSCRDRKNLLTVNLPNATSVGSFAFYGCSSLTTVNAPLMNLNPSVFYGCSSLKSIVNEKTYTIGVGCFNGCTKLEKVDLRTTRLNLIAAQAFQKCSALSVLIIRRTDAICTLGNASAFTNTPIANGTGYIYVPRVLIETYKSATNWSTYASQFRALEDYTVDGTITGALDLTKI